MAIVLALAAALAWGVADFGSGMKSRSVSALVVTLSVFVVGGFVTVAIAAVAEPAPGSRTLAWAGLAGIVASIGVTTFFYALAIGEIGTVASIVAAGTSVPVIIGFARGERPTAVSIAGMVLVIVGVIVMVSVPTSATTTARDPHRAVLLALAASVTLGLYYVVGKAGAAHSPLWYAAVGQISAAALLVVLVVGRRAGIPTRRDTPHLVALGLANAAGWVFSVLALRLGMLTLVSVLVSLYPSLTVLLALVFAGERLTRLQYLSAAAIIAGVALVAGG
jgi:drug/metabolite transporter (DMT)-like permease